MAIVGFTVWYVWHSKQVADKTLSQANAINQSAASNPKYLVIKELKVRFKLPTDLPEVPFAHPAESTVVVSGISLTSNLLTNEPRHDYKCISSGSENTFLDRYKVGDENPGSYAPFATQGGPTLTQSDLNNATKPYGAHVGEYYYVLIPPPRFCFDNPSELKTNTAVKQVYNYQLELSVAIGTMLAVN